MEEAIGERVGNTSPAERRAPDDIDTLTVEPKPRRDVRPPSGGWTSRVVERSVARRSGVVRSRGGIGSEHLGMSSANTGATPVDRKFKGSNDTGNRRWVTQCLTWSRTATWMARCLGAIPMVTALQVTGDRVFSHRIPKRASSGAAGGEVSPRNSRNEITVPQTDTGEQVAPH